MDQQLTALAQQQDGLVNAADLRARKLSRRAEARVFDCGFLRQFDVRVFAVDGAPTTHRMRLRAGLLTLGEQSWVSYEAAAALLALDRSDRTAVEFTVPRGVRRLGRAVTIHATQWMPLIDQVIVDGFRTTSATRTIIDLAHGRSSRIRVEAAFDSAVRLGLSAPRVLAQRIQTLRGSGRRGCRLIDDLVVDSGGHSPLERLFLRLVRTAGLTRPTTQASAVDRIVV